MEKRSSQFQLIREGRVGYHSGNVLSSVRVRGRDTEDDEEVEIVDFNDPVI